jgi:hypothetical protein
MVMADRDLSGLILEGMIPHDGGGAAPDDWDGGHVLLKEGAYLRNPGDYNCWHKVAYYRSKTPCRLFAMQHGPYIPWALAVIIYEAYAAQHGSSQSIEKMNDRGGFSWREVEVIFSGLLKDRPKKLEELKTRWRIPYISPVMDRQ